MKDIHTPRLFQAWNSGTPWHWGQDPLLYHGTGAISLAGINPPPLRVSLLKPLGGYGGVPLAQEVPNSDRGSMVRRRETAPAGQRLATTLERYRAWAWEW